MRKIIPVVLVVSLVLLGAGLTLLVVSRGQNDSGIQNPHIFSERLPTDEEMKGLRQNLRREIADLSKYGDHRTATEKKQITSFQQAWAKVNPTIAPFLGQRRGTDNLGIYPSRTQGTVCISQTFDVGEQTIGMDLAIGTVVKGRVQTTAQQILVLDQNYLGIASVRPKPYMGPYIRALDPPIPLLAASSVVVAFSHSRLMLERFNRANCTNDLPETARRVSLPP